MVKWLNHVTIAAPRNASNSHTVDPSSGTAVSGALFTPTAGRFLVVVAEGAVTSTTPSGWTLPSGGSAVNNTGIYLWYRTAAGGDTFSTTHNGTDYPVSFDIYEFPAGTTLIGSVASANIAPNGSQVDPILSGLTASANFRAGAVGQGISSGSASSFTWSIGTEAVDAGAAASTTDGYGYSLTYSEDETGDSYSPSATSTVTITSCERITFALNVPASANSGTLSATLPRASVSLSGTSTNPGALEVSTPLLTASLNGSSTDPGNLSASVPPITGSMMGEARNSGSLNASTPLLVTSIEEEATSIAMLDAALPRASWSSVGESRNSGALNVALPPVVGVAQGSQTNSGSLEGRVFLIESEMLGDSIVTGSLDAELAALRFSIEDLGGRRDVTVLSMAEVPTTAVTVAEIGRSVVIQEIP